MSIARLKTIPPPLTLCRKIDSQLNAVKFDEQTCLRIVQLVADAPDEPFVITHQLVKLLLQFRFAADPPPPCNVHGSLSPSG